MRSSDDSFRQDRLKDRSDIGTVQFQIERLVRLRNAAVSCVHVESMLERNHGLSGLARPRGKRDEG